MSLPPSPTLRAFLRRFRRDRSGVTAVEFALIAGPFFFIIFAIIETALATTAGVFLNDAVNTAARNVLTGQVQASDMDADGFRAQICDRVDVLMSCDRLKLDLRTYPAGTPIPDFQMKDGSIDSSTFCFDPGAQDTITVLRAYYEWPWTTAILNRLASDTNGNAILYSVAAFMNEPFGSVTSQHVTC